MNCAEKMIRANNLLQFIHQVTIEFRFRKSLAQERFKSNLEFRLPIIYLRALPTHTLNTLLQKLNYVKQYSVVKQKFNIIHIICENFRTIPWVLCKIQLI